MAHAVLGPELGHSPFASRVAALRADDGALETLAAEALATASIRLLVAVPSGQEADAWRLAADDLAPLAARPAPRARALVLSDRIPRAQPPALALQQARDGRHVTVVGWDLSGGARALGLSSVERDALLLVLERLLAHPGGPLRSELVAERAAVRDLAVELRDGAGPVLLVEAEARGATPGQARTLTVASVERLVVDPPGSADLAGARRAAAADLRRQWQRPSSRLGLLSTLTAAGRLTRMASPDAWVSSVDTAIAAVDAGRVTELASWVLREDRRTVADITPETPTGAGGVLLDDDLLSTYVRIMVDTRCPRLPIDAAELLRKKYQLEARTFVAITRAIAQRPEVMRALSEEANLRCEEYRKLRTLMSMDRAIGLHEALACGPGQAAASPTTTREVNKILRRFDVDPSWVRPLLGMWREDLEAAAALDAIDASCPTGLGVP